jgi:hypothetical protein
VLKFNFVPKALCKPLQNLELKRESLSEIMDTGTPCNLTIFLT